MLALLLGLGLCPTGAAAAEVTVLREGATPTPGYVGTQDVMLQQHTEPVWDPSANYDAQENQVDGSPSDKAVLLRWDVSSIPPGSVVTGVEVYLYITSESSSGYELYECLRPWHAGEATWSQAQLGAPWALPGAQQEGADRGSAVLGTVEGSTGGRVFKLNAQGVAAVQRWVDDPTRNHGFVIQDYLNTDGIDFRNSAHSEPAHRPELRVIFDSGSPAEFQNGVRPSAAYAGQVDTVIAQGFNPEPPGVNANGGGLHVGADDPASVSLLSFELAAIPADATVTAASLEVALVDGSVDTFPVFAALRSWRETEATWFLADAASSWSTPGASGAADRGALLGTIPATSGQSGTVSIPLNAAGVELVQRWVEGAANHGFIIANAAASDALRLVDHEDPSVALRPALVVTWTQPPDGGVPDGGVPDGGADAGPDTPDAGSEVPDAGAGPGLPREFRVGCASAGASSLLLPAAMALFVLGACRRQRRGPAARRPPRPGKGAIEV